MNNLTEIHDRLRSATTIVAMAEQWDDGEDLDYAYRHVFRALALIEEQIRSENPRADEFFERIRRDVNARCRTVA